MIQDIRSMVTSNVPSGSIVVVATKGDPQLVRFDRRLGWHFPQQSDGTYAGYHPKDDQDAIRHLEVLRAKGAEYFVLPATALWWREYYGKFFDHLLEQGGIIASNDNACAIFCLRKPEHPLPKTQTHVGFSRRSRQLEELVDALLPRGAQIAVLQSGRPNLIHWNNVEASGTHAADSECFQFSPADETEAISQLGQLWRSGNDYLILPRDAGESIPRLSQWRSYLDRNCRLVTDQIHVCAIFDLSNVRAERSDR